jgi:hypothetical protein
MWENQTRAGEIKMKISFHKFNKNQPWQWSRLEEIHYHYYEISLGRFWVAISFNPYVS